MLVDLGALAANYRAIAALQPNARIAGVVKADAYGLGARPVSATLYNAGCRNFFVAHLVEAMDLRPTLPADARVFVLNGLAPGAESAAAQAGVIPVLNSLDQAHRWADESRRCGMRLASALQVDSGMTRLGLSEPEVDALAGDPALRSHLDVILLMSHLACADESEHSANLQQFACFETLAARLPEAPRALANSGGAFLAGFGLDMVRPGLALYGVHPVEGQSGPLRPVLALSAPIVQTRDVPAGTGVGYGLAHTTERACRLATVAIGYADGWPRSLSGRGSVFCGGVRAPIVGRVSMDSIVIDVTDVPAEAVRPGAMVELIGPHQSLADVARDAGTIPYEILTGLGQRFARRTLPA
ncbi:alanine racemase [uncultured Alsobacter sp.]|uniref:alanine racemase n=1 Tax=uncultured Alsobacter sp. TaxID=1748258 RepID=UPI0025DFE50F|nr:alanine racemase [uncultured Alsobacter sp.]